MHSCTFIFSKIITCFTLMAPNFTCPSAPLPPSSANLLNRLPPQTASCKNIGYFFLQILFKIMCSYYISSRFTVWFRVSDARVLLWAKMDFSCTMLQWVTIFIACGGFFWTCVNWQSCNRNPCNVSVLQHVIRGNFAATKGVSRGGHVVVCAYWTIISNCGRRQFLKFQSNCYK